MYFYEQYQAEIALLGSSHDHGTSIGDSSTGSSGLRDRLLFSHTDWVGH